MGGCSIPGCKNRTDKSAKTVRFFSFPRNRETLQQWLKMCPSVNERNLKKSCVCSAHFEPSEYKPKPEYLQNCSNYSPKRRRILDTAIPTRNLNGERTDNTMQNATTSKANDSCQIIQSNPEMLAVENSVAKDNVEASANEVPGAVHHREPRLITCTNLVENDRSNELDRLQNKILQLEKENLVLKKLDRTRYQQIREANNSLRKKNSALKKDLKRLKSKQYLHGKIKELMKPTLTSNQVNKILHPNKKCVRWKIEDISRAITLKSISAQAYKLMQKLNYPLPGFTSLRRWASGMDMNEGLLTDVLKMMETKASLLPAHQKLVVISFDEMYLSQKIEMDKKFEQVVGPHKTAQVCIARGLFSNWKQPIFYRYDQSLTSQILHEIIVALWNAGYTVVSVVTDLGGNNPDAFKDYKIGIYENKGQKCFFHHPCNNDLKVFVFADVPHLLKLFRNHFLDEGYEFRELLMDGNLVTKVINKEIIQELLALNDRDELKVAFKVTSEQLEVSKAKRQRVFLATKLFSKSTARAIEWAGRANLLKYKDWEKTAEIFELFNDWFDVFNSTARYGYKHGQKPYGVDLEQQNSILNRATDFIKAIRFGKQKTYRPFQKGIILNNKSLQLLLPYIKSTFSTEKFKIEYILTNRLNQDCLENLFSILRAMGRTNDHPSALDFRYRLKWYTLGKHASIILSKAKNAQDDSAEPLLSLEESFTASNEYDDTRLLDFNDISLEGENDDNHRDSVGYSNDFADDSSVIMQDLGIEDFDDYEERFKGYIPNRPSIRAQEISNDQVKELIKEEALKYITGYTASRFINKYPHLGNQTRKLNLPAKTSDWLLTISDGYLIYPSDMLLQVARIVRNVFIQVHGKTSLSKERYIITRVADIVFKKVSHYKLDVALAVVKHMVKTHTYIRLREMQVAKKKQEEIAKAQKKWTRENKQILRHAEKKIQKFTV